MASKFFEGFGTAIKKLMKALGWLIPIAALIVAVVFIIQRRPNPTYTEKPDQLMSKYVEKVLVFAPPSTQLPTQADFDELLEFFTKEKRDWARKNLDALAWLGLSMNEQAFQQADAQNRMHAAYRFIVLQGPTQAMTIQKVAEAEDKNHVTITAASISQTRQIPMALEGGRWRIAELWGIPSRFATPLSAYETQHGKQ